MSSRGPDHMHLFLNLSDAIVGDHKISRLLQISGAPNLINDGGDCPP